MNILARGTRPFRLLERQDDLPYPAGVVEFLGDGPRSPTRTAGSARARELYARARRAGNRPRARRRRSSRELDSYAWRPPSSSALDAKQELLELRSENARLRLLRRCCGAAIERLELLERAQARAHSNGKVRFG